MPVAASIGGGLTRVASAGGGAAVGVLSVIGFPSTGAGGVLAVDRTLFLAFYARVRLTRPDVYVADELMPHLVDTVSLDYSLDDPIDYAQFTISDKRVAFFDAASLSDGERDIAIDLFAGPPGSTILGWNAFNGTTETSTNVMPYRPRGTFRAVSLAAKWADLKGCVNIPAFSELTRGQIIAAFAESAGVVISNASTLKGGIVRRPVDIAGRTPFELIQEYGEVEGWYARATEDGTGLEVIDEAQMLAGEPIFFFDESNTFDVPESTPNRPVTDWILSATEVIKPEQALDGNFPPVTVIATVEGIDQYGNATEIETKITTVAGVEIERVETTWETISTPGVDTPDPKFQITSRITVRNTWEPFTYVNASGVSITMLSTLLSRRVTTTEILSGIPCSVANSDAFDWVDGGRFDDPHARLLTTEILTEDFTWFDDCTPESTRKTTEQYYAPLGDPADTANVFVYADGSYRKDDGLGRYLWRTVEESFTNWGNVWTAGHGLVAGKTALSKYFPTGHAVSPNEAMVTESYKQVIVTAEPPETTQPISGSANQPQFSQRVIMAEVDATEATGYTRRTESPGALDYAENIDELKRIGYRRIWRDTSDTLAIPHNAIPFLRVGDHVAVTNRARNLIEKDAYVYSINRTAAVMNGAMRQVTTVKIPKLPLEPDWL